MPHTSRCLNLGAFDSLAFLGAWHAWLVEKHHALKKSPALSHLHVVAHCEQPLQGRDVLQSVEQSAAAAPELLPLAQQLAKQCWGLLPGVHRLRFEKGFVTLTLCIGAADEWQKEWPTHLSGDCRAPNDLPLPQARTVTLVGAGIAGAGTARALAERGWLVTVLDACESPAGGASGLPVGVIAPHTSHDDSAVSRLSRAGLRLMEFALQTHVQEGVDWASTGVQERRLPGKTRRGGVPLSWLDGQPHASAAQDWTLKAPAPAPDDAYWHPHGAWVKPAPLVRALLNHPNIIWRGNARVDALVHHANDAQPWRVQQGTHVLATSARVVLAAGPGSAALIASATADASSPRINPLRGQVSWGLMSDAPNAPMPRTPVNGNGSFVHSITTDVGPAWFTGATFDRENAEPVLLDSDHAENLSRLRALQPDTAAALAPVFESGAVRGWVGMRCGVHDRLPLVGQVWNAPEGLHLNTAMGSRGLTLALLCGELLAAQWHGEPLPVESRLAKFLDASRFKPKA